MLIPYRALLQQKTAWPRVLGIITCKTLRKQDELYKDRLEEVIQTIASQKFCDFVNRNKLYLVATGGSYDRLKDVWGQYSVLNDRICRVQPSAPGVIQIANLVVFGFCRAILFFNDSEDIYADSPQNLALRRICNEFNVPLVEDIASIRYLLNRWYKEPKFHLSASHEQKPAKYPEGALGQYFGNDEEMRRIGDDRSDRSRETLAVIAHNDKKMEMLRFCAKHVYEILAYRRVLTTGTTGEKLRGLYNEILRLSDDVRARFGIARPEMIPDFVNSKICPFKSGPEGGDIQISSKIIEGSCHRVIFFEDPKSAHPHQFDVRLLEKSVQSHSTSTLFATSTEMAELIV
jgi:methylglyoxal synthase